MKTIAAVALTLVLVLALTGQAQGQASPNSPLNCVRGSGAWDAKTSTLTVISLYNGCDVATASPAYSWTEDDQADFQAMVVSQANSTAFTAGCLQEEMANHNKDCGQWAHDLIAETLHAARAKRERLCSRHADWWIVSVDDSGAFGPLESCRAN